MFCCTIKKEIIFCRSSWTDTPSDKQNKNEQVSMDQLRKETALKETLKRDKTQEEIAKKSKTKRKDMSLLEIHQEKLKKEKKVIDLISMSGMFVITFFVFHRSLKKKALEDRLAVTLICKLIDSTKLKRSLY